MSSSFGWRESHCLWWGALESQVRKWNGSDISNIIYLWIVWQRFWLLLQVTSRLRGSCCAPSWTSRSPSPSCSPRSSSRTPFASSSHSSSSPHPSLQWYRDRCKYKSLWISYVNFCTNQFESKQFLWTTPSILINEVGSVLCLASSYY